MLTNMMRHTVDLYRQNLTQATAQEVEGYSLVERNIPCFVQPADSQMQNYYGQRGSAITHTVYTTSTATDFRREDILLFGDAQFHIVNAPLSGLASGIYLELHCEQYPEGAKKRLDMEAYE